MLSLLIDHSIYGKFGLIVYTMKENKATLSQWILAFLFGEEKCKTYELIELGQQKYEPTPCSGNGVGLHIYIVLCSVTDIFAFHGSIFISYVDHYGIKYPMCNKEKESWL